MLRVLMIVSAAALAAACAPWARGPRVSPIESGLVGDWIGPVRPGSVVTTHWQFTPDGTSGQMHIRPSHRPQQDPFGPFRVYADTGNTQLICFSFRRGRARPGCRYFHIDTLTDASQQVGRRLRLLNWVGEKKGTPEIWTERSP